MATMPDILDTQLTEDETVRIMREVLRDRRESGMTTDELTDAINQVIHMQALGIAFALWRQGELSVSVDDSGQLVIWHRDHRAPA